MEKITGAKVIIETLKRLGTDTIFGYPGGIVLKIYDELYKQKDIKHILVRHEQAAVHAAEGYARVTGKPGVVLVTSGPGATNTVTGIANAYLDGFPLVILTGQVSKELIGQNAFQEADICDITKPCSKAVFQIKQADTLEQTLVKAFNTAMDGKKGPVVVDIAKNVLYEETVFDGNIVKSESVFPKVDVMPVLNEIKSAKFPVMVTGGGSVGAYQQVRTLAKLLNLPVVSTIMGLGVYDQLDENYLGMIGIFGDNAANQAIREADLIFSVGARFNDRITCCFDNVEKKIIRLDINKEELDKKSAYMSICGDAKIILQDMIENSKPLSKFCDYQRLKELNKKSDYKSNRLQSFEVMQELQKFIADKDLTVTTEVGQHQLWAARYLKFRKPLKFLTSGGLGTMGFGFPAAIGACVADSSKPVVCVAGDGSFQMNMQELAVCRDYNLPVKIILLNNGYLGMVRQLQEKQCGGRYFETKISNPDFLKIAESYDLKAFRVHKKDEILPALEKAFETKGTVLIDFIIEPMEML